MPPRIGPVSILGGPVIDYETGEVFALLEAERRFSDRWIVALEARAFMNSDPSTPSDATISSR